MFNLLHNFSPNPILMQLGPISIRYYGLIIVLVLGLAIWLAFKLAKGKISADDTIDLAFWLALSGIIGARLYEVLILESGYFWSHPAEIIKIWHGGLAIHGAIIGGIIALVVWCYKKKQDFWFLADLAAVVLPLAQAIGRWGNYFNQEVFGRPTDLPWGIAIDLANRPLEFTGEKYFHPTFLYESILNLILFFILLFLYKKQRLKSGQYLGVYLIGYGVIRFLMEFIRIDQTALFFGFRWPQIFSLIVIFVGLMIIWRKKKK
jgi:phosphatidylglycerol:prolipoprotein diacylglycerol transferase